jgi:hypothetical protein
LRLADKKQSEKKATVRPATTQQEMLPMKSKPISFDEVKRIREELVEMGLVQDSGRRRNGQVVWVLSPLGGAYAERLRENKQPH